MSSPLDKHRCHARNCPTEVPPKMFMCREHWYMVPKADRDLVWALYQPGQEVFKNPTQEYLEHTMHCIDLVAAKEAARG